jgi:hypothetical protein
MHEKYIDNIDLNDDEEGKKQSKGENVYRLVFKCYIYKDRKNALKLINTQNNIYRHKSNNTD